MVLDRASLLIPLLLLGALLLARPAHADARVTLCAADNQAGAGVNLSAALAAGGKVTFACGKATIRVNCSHRIGADLEIDGGGLVTLAGPAGGPNTCGSSSDYSMFDASSAPGQLTLKLERLTITGARMAFGPAGPVRLPGTVARGKLALSLADVVLTDSLNPISIASGAFHAERSRLSGDSGLVVEAGAVELRDHTQFADNPGDAIRSRGGAVSIADADFTRSGSVNLSDCSTAAITRAHFTGATAGALRIDCNADIRDSSFTSNRGGDGGALFVGYDATQVSLRDVDFTGNSASNAGGALFRFDYGAPLPGARTLTLQRVTFRNNSAPMGGAVFFGSAGRWTLVGSAVQFTGNQATSYGGALLAVHASLQLDHAIFTGNRAGAAGGAVMAGQTGDATSTLSNSLLAGNTAPAAAAFGGAGATFINTTVADNTGPAISPLLKLSFWSPPAPAADQPIRFRNTVLKGGSDPACDAANAKASYADGGANLQYPGASCGASIPSGFPLLGPGYIPLPLSPALGRGDDAVCAAAPVSGRDLWGLSRPHNAAHCAIGAAEGSPQDTLSHLVDAAGKLGKLVGCAGACR